MSTKQMSAKERIEELKKKVRANGGVWTPEDNKEYDFLAGLRDAEGISNYYAYQRYSDQMDKSM